MLRGLCIGINTYGQGNDLQGCVNDAHDWRAALDARGYLTETLLDSAATGDAIRAGILDVLARSKYGDRVVITFSGHGSFVPDQSGDEPDQLDECWCAADAFSSDSGVVLDDDLAKLLQTRGNGIRVAVISDSCHSGTMTRHYGVASGRDRRIRFLPPGEFASEIDRARLRNSFGISFRRVSVEYPAVLLAGCRDDQYSYDAYFGGRANGAFTRAALEALAHNPSTYTSWMWMIQRQLPSRDYPQTPTLRARWYQRFWGVF